MYVLSCDTLLLPEQLISLFQSVQDNSVFKQGITLLNDDGQFLPLLAHWSVEVAGSLKNAFISLFNSWAVMRQSNSGLLLDSSNACL